MYEVLAEKLGVTTDRILKLQKAGKITADMGVFAVLKAIEETFSGGKLGNAMEQFADNLSGLWSTLKGRPLALMLGFDETEGYKSLKGFIGNLANLLDPKSKNGQRIKTATQGLFSSIFSTLFGPLKKATSGDKGARWVYKIIYHVQKVEQWFRKNWPTIVEYAKAFGEGFVQGL